jgi:nitrate/nitrite-specific signal transduction histidine kinase
LDIAKAEDLTSALRVVLQRLCEKSGWALGQAWVVEEGGKHLHMTASWIRGGPELEAFSRESQGLRLDRGISLPGMALDAGEAVWVPDVTEHALFPTAVRRDAALRAGIKAALGVPISSGDDVIAVLEFGMTQVLSEDPHFTDLTLAIANQIGLAIQRKRAEEMVRESREQLRALAGKLQAVREEERTRIAREIHDILAQDLTRLKIEVGWINKRLPTLCKDGDVTPLMETGRPGQHWFSGGDRMAGRRSSRVHRDPMRRNCVRRRFQPGSGIENEHLSHCSGKPDQCYSPRERQQNRNHSGTK